MILSHSTSLNLWLLLLGEGIKGLAGDYVAAAAPSTELPPGAAAPQGTETHCTHGSPLTRVPGGFLATCPEPETPDGTRNQEQRCQSRGSQGHPGAGPRSGRAPSPAAWRGPRGTPPGAAGRAGSPRTPPASPLADGWQAEDGALGRPVDDALALLPPALHQGPDEDPAGDVSVPLSLAWGVSGVGWAMPWAGVGGSASPGVAGTAGAASSDGTRCCQGGGGFSLRWW